ncbi:hypothetical protein [Actinomadura chibensis]|uniref:Uncharacterized protein n=1 Tax=Actinomadura chibensis TaxID=392828 RepID=A0A5D0NXX2_9ACTN|nr:hypothetical protein [Actinomadura chibensis]TYB49034.1 hypothetical protein FXF69_07780 [Actinomadura chibensis]
MTILQAPAAARDGGRSTGGAWPDAVLLFRPLLAVDIQDYSARTPAMQLRAQTCLRAAMSAAAEESGLVPQEWSQQLRGDGELDVLPGDALVAVTGEYAPALERALARANREGGADDRLRVRLALHHGALVTGPPASFGPAGEAPVLVSRLLDSRPLRRYLTLHPERDVAFIVSVQIYRDVISSGLCALPPHHFRYVRTVIKGSPYQGYIHEPDRP